jgi:hypothetical protein
MNRLTRNDYCHFRRCRGLLLTANEIKVLISDARSLAVWRGLDAKLREVASHRRSSNRNNQTCGVRLGRNIGAKLRLCVACVLFLSTLSCVLAPRCSISANADSCSGGSGDQETPCYIPGGSFPRSQNLTIRPCADTVYDFTVYLSEIYFNTTPLSKSRDSSVGIANGVGVRVPVGSRIFTFQCRPDRFWGTPSLLFNVPRALSPGVKRPGREADHSPTSVEVKKTWIYTSPPS